MQRAGGNYPLSEPKLRALKRAPVPEYDRMAALIELAGDLVSRFEQEHHAIKPANPRDALRFLMETRCLKQEDLRAVAPQSNLSAILADKRKISATMAGKLGKFFGISPAVFVPT
jgi:HTH-type transcriptional regulator/antitoxin HigA